LPRRLCGRQFDLTRKLRRPKAKKVIFAKLFPNLSFEKRFLFATKFYIRKAQIPKREQEQPDE
jgi:hypothetical protein